MGIAYVRFAVNHPSHYRVMFGGLVRPDDNGERDADDPAVDNYTSQLGSIEALHASTTPQPAAVTNEPVKTAFVPPAQTAVSNELAPKAIVMTTAAPVNQPVATPKPPARIQPPEPVEEDWLSFLKNWIASLWQSVLF